jgi:hypothetical protein
MSLESVSAVFKKHPLRAGLVLVSIGLAAAIYIRYTQMPDVEAALEEKASQGQKLKANLSNSALLKEQVDSLIAANKQVESRLIKAGDIAKNQQYFYKLEAEAGVKLLDIRQLTTPSKSTGSSYMAVPYSLNIQGSYAHVMLFIKRLEGGIHFCRIVGANGSHGSNVERASSPDDEGTISLSLNIELLGQS